MQQNIRFILFNIFLFIIFLFVDFYAFQTVKTAALRLQPGGRRLVAVIYWTITLGIYTAFISGFIYDWRKWPQLAQIIFLTTAVTLFIVKVTLVIFALADDGLRLIKFSRQMLEPETVGKQGISRSQFIATIGVLAAAIPFYSFIKGVVSSAYNFQYRKKEILIANLPAAMRGLKIVQLSDIHAGSLYRKEPLHEVVKRINEWKPDFIFFTGDLVNDVATEADAIIPVFKNLEAKYGVYSITGNHDYGDYVNWSSKEEKADNFKRLMEAHKKLGWDLLMNEHRTFNFGDASLAVIGIENWGGSLRFPRYGHLDKAYQGAESADVKILLSHDPSHWDLEIRAKYPDIDLTLSGHTHGLQIGIENKYFKWSPSKYLYKQWADLYSEGKQQIYVNRGFGFIGYPGRVGILPEVTLITLA